MKIYCARPISGCTVEQVQTYYHDIEIELKSYGFDVITPLVKAEYARTDIKFKSEGPAHGVCNTNKAITKRDSWFVDLSDICFLNVLGCERVSIGSVCEFAWAWKAHKHTILVMEQDNIHRHAFLMEMADLIFNSLDEAKDYLKDLSGKGV